jgi:hypothetical protein
VSCQITITFGDHVHIACLCEANSEPSEVLLRIGTWVEGRLRLTVRAVYVKVHDSADVANVAHVWYDHHLRLIFRDSKLTHTQRIWPKWQPQIHQSGRQVTGHTFPALQWLQLLADLRHNEWKASRHASLSCLNLNESSHLHRIYICFSHYKPSNYWDPHGNHSSSV